MSLTPLARHALSAVLASTLAAPMLSQAMSLEDRVACQRAIDQVYWRHRSEAGQAPRRPFDEAVPMAASRRKAEDAVRKSAALARWWGTELSPAQLQAELDRMAASSQSPAVLAELFTALGHDARRAAECLARPALAERLVQTYFANDPRWQGAARAQAQADWARLRAGGSPGQGVVRTVHWTGDRAAAQAAGTAAQWVSPHELAQRTQALRRAEGGAAGQPALGRFGPLRENDQRLYSLALDVLDDQQVKLRSVSWPKADFDRWWAAQRPQLPLSLPMHGASYRLPALAADANCRDDSWKPTLAGLDGRYEHAAVWTGSEMIVWGGMEAVGNLYRDGARYNPATDTWAPVSTVGAPSPRAAFANAWTGREMVIFGGTGDTTGGRYDPVTDTWRPTATAGAPIGQQWSASAWTGQELLVWGGILGVPVNTGARYNPRTDTWRPLPAAPLAPRAYTPGVWTGREFIVWTGYDVTQGRLYRDGARYDPVTDRWAAISAANAPQATYFQTAVWTGTELLAWGGVTGAAGNGRYNPATDRWSPMATTGAPANRFLHNAVWTGSEMLVLGGSPSAAAGGRYNPATDTWQVLPLPGGAAGGQSSTMVWTGTEALLWGGLDDDFAFRGDGSRYHPAANRWRPMSTMNVPSARGYHNAEWTGAEMVVWSGWGSVFAERGARFDPATNTWSPMSTMGQPMPRQNATSVWTGTDIVYWGGATTDPFTPDTGGRYDPATDTWRAVSRRNAPFSTYGHTAVWTGTEMITFGGISSSPAAKRYNPATDTWTSATRRNEPGHRDHHAAVWTGTEMIVWGGSIDSGALGPRGGRYDPATDTWVRIARSPGQPEARAWPAAVWTGTEMIVWGGYDYLYGVSFGDGARYNPASGAWTPTAQAGAPSPRVTQAVWTGTEMIVWGGDDFGTGGRYDPAADRWQATSMTRAPAPLWGGRWSTVWTGQQMIVWGGLGPTQKGGLYCASGQPNAAPVAAADARVARSGQPLVNGVTRSLLRNDTDANGDPLSARLLSGPANGSLQLNANGSFVYRSRPGFVGVDRFQYVAHDDLLDSPAAWVEIDVR